MTDTGNVKLTGPASTPDGTKMVAMQLAIQISGASQLIETASKIEDFLRGKVVYPDEMKAILLKRADTFNPKPIALAFTEQNFTAALTLIGDMASYIKGE